MYGWSIRILIATSNSHVNSQMMWFVSSLE